jgi:phosphate transport system substrate-binding protein
MRRPSRLLAWLLSIGALTYVALAGGTDDNTSPGRPACGRGGASPAGDEPVTCAPGTISGAGATFPQAIVQQWIKDYGGACPRATVAYQAVGSGAGVQQFTAGTVDFGASDAVMTPEEQQAAERTVGPVLHVPWTAGGIAIVYNLPAVADLRLRPDTVAGIFAGRITRWDDPVLAADNPEADLPATPIQVVHRSDGSGTTQVFTSYLTAVAPTVWNAGAAKDVPWPTGQGAKGSDGVTAVVKQTEGAISYTELSYAAANDLGVAQLRNPAGRFVGPTPAGVTAALEDATVPADLRVQVTFTPTSPDAYPISTTSWALVPARPADPGRGALMQAFLLYALGPGQEAAAPLSFAPLPRPLAVRAQAAVYAMELPTSR